MRMISRILLALCVATLSVAALEGCAKKKAPAPATPPPAPAPATTPTPAPTTTPPPTPAPVETPKPPAQDTDFQTVYFDFDASALRDDARAALDANARILRDNSTLKVRIEGNCDERGTVEYNMALGERRAVAARDYLVSQGIDASRMTVVSYGKEKPVAEGHDESAWKQNRRDEFHIVK